MTLDDRIRRLRWRATHRGTKEADILVGGFMDRYLAGWGEAEIAWFEALMEEQDVDILAWAFGKAPPPAYLDGPLMAALVRLDYVPVPR